MEIATVDVDRWCLTTEFPVEMGIRYTNKSHITKQCCMEDTIYILWYVTSCPQFAFPLKALLQIRSSSLIVDALGLFFSINMRFLDLRPSCVWHYFFSTFD